jgi:hypothetical protein
MTQIELDLSAMAFFRVTVLPDDYVEVVKVGDRWGKAGECRTSVVRVECLPERVTNKLAVLNMRSYTPPTEEIPGVGRRISRDVFWVFDEE